MTNVPVSKMEASRLYTYMYKKVPLNYLGMLTTFLQVDLNG